MLGEHFEVWALNTARIREGVDPWADLLAWDPISAKCEIIRFASEDEARGGARVYRLQRFPEAVLRLVKFVDGAQPSRVPLESL